MSNDVAMMQLAWSLMLEGLKNTRVQLETLLSSAYYRKHNRWGTIVNETDGYKQWSYIKDGEGDNPELTREEIKHNALKFHLLCSHEPEDTKIEISVLKDELNIKFVRLTLDEVDELSTIQYTRSGDSNCS